MESSQGTRRPVILGNIGRDDVEWYDVRKAPFQIFGLYHPETEPIFKRLPDEIGLNTNRGIKELYLESAGGRIRFSTDSEYVAVRVEYNFYYPSNHFAASGKAGLDLYIDEPELRHSRYYRTYVPPVELKDGFEERIDLPKDGRMRFFTIHMPPYASVLNLYVGLQKEAKLDRGLPYRDMKPIVYYGSSITQGACASRPGNAYENLISEHLNLDYVNLGFSGNCLGEDIIVNYMATLEMSAFVSDYDHNTPDAAHLRATHEKLYRAIRAAHPDIPYIMISRPDFYLHVSSSRERQSVVYETYRKAMAEGDENVWFIDGASFFRGRYEDACTVDATHPNDLGFALMADQIEREILHAFADRLS